MSRQKIHPRLVVFDFDGVLTDNKVYVTSDGTEMVCCDRSDGLAFDMLRKAKIPCLILSTEKNKVVAARAKKLKVKFQQGVRDKAIALKAICKREAIPLGQVLYVGNDINDLTAMKLVGMKICPVDAHSQIKRIADVVLPCRGGSGVARTLVEKFLGLGY